MDNKDNLITKYPEGIDFLEDKLDIMGIPKGDMSPVRKQMIKNMILTLARQ